MFFHRGRVEHIVIVRVHIANDAAIQHGDKDFVFIARQDFFDFLFCQVGGIIVSHFPRIQIVNRRCVGDRTRAD